MNNHLVESPFCCRICFKSESDTIDPLVTPCNCTGTMSYIHFKCLKLLIKSRLIVKSNEDLISYTWKNYNCEICLTDYPKYIKWKNKTYNLIDIFYPFDKYVQFDYILFDDIKKKCIRKGIFVVRMEDSATITLVIK